MRKVLRNSDEVFHYWANQVQSEGRAGSVSFHGKDLYSYAACIGRHLGNGVVAISDYKYSITTSGHQSGARAAARHLKIIHVSYPSSINDSKSDATRKVAVLVRMASTARQRKDSYLAEALEITNNFNAFAEALESAERLQPPVTDKDALAAIAATVKAEDAKRKAAIAERKRVDAQTIAECVAKWRADGTNHWQLRNAPCALRLHGDLVLTSHGAQIQVASALRLWPLIQRAKRGQREYEVGQPVGVYRLTKIRSNGSIVVGCHDIAFEEIEGIAKQLQLIEEGVPA